ncbi:hypothetical protein D9757_002354 [Collybiopsis confluens]|uniref:Uncharacterized protein n=1 Tax=Collybiopsis confluens TaxID=2823264 RepID=A0A8H5HY38_9AGAR|nr:hypothetical protein D9757_002354 [Collybiopsis confluens]
MILDNKTLPLPSTEIVEGTGYPIIQIVKEDPDAPPAYETVAAVAETSIPRPRAQRQYRKPVSPYAPPPSTRYASEYASSSTSLGISGETARPFAPPPSTRYAPEFASSSASLTVSTFDQTSVSGRSIPLGGEPSLASPAGGLSSSTLYSPPVFSPKHKRSWFSSKSRTIKEVREWAMNQINDLLGKRFSELEECKSVLNGCRDALSAYSVSMSTFLQEPLSQQHTFFYWSIVNRSSESTRLPTLLSALLSFGTPLTEDTRADIRNACLLMNDEPLFQSLRRYRDFMRLPASHEIVFGDGALPVDDVTVENMLSAEPAFLVKMKIAQFVKRVNFEKDVTIEFIAQRRAWKLTFSVSSSKNPKWDLTLTLLENGESTPMDSQLVIEDVSSEAAADSKPQPPLTVRMKHSMLVPSKKDKIVVSLEDGSLIGSSIRSP